MRKEQAQIFEASVTSLRTALDNYLYNETNKFVYADRESKDLIVYLGERERDLIFYNAHDLSKDAVILRQGKSYLYGMLVIPVDLESYLHIALKVGVE